MAKTTGYRDESNDGKVTHFRLGPSILCLTKGDNRSASTSPKDVNCKKCLVKLATLKAVR